MIRQLNMVSGTIVVCVRDLWSGVAEGVELLTRGKHEQERCMPPTNEALMQAILDAPEDDSLRLVYADWLDEHGDAERAEFIRVQIELATLPRHERRAVLGKRAKELLARNEEEWVRPIRDRVVAWAFRRGFVSAVTVTYDAYMKYTFELVRLAPIERIQVEQTGSVDIAGSAITLIPEHIARQHSVLPLGHAHFDHDFLLFAVPSPTLEFAEWWDSPTIELIQRLSFILNRDRMTAVEADPEQLEEEINRRYGPSDPAKYPVKMEVFADQLIDGKQKLQVKLAIEEGYCIFANPSDHDQLPPTRFVLSRGHAAVTYPPGEVVRDPVAGDYRVYRGDVTLEAVVTRAAGDSAPLEVAVLVRPFDKTGIRGPAKSLKATVP
jgi:uncharacterized protein (TIGR02996 family)